MLLLLAIACTSPGTVRGNLDDSGTSADSGTAHTGETGDSGPALRCPTGMADLGAVCIDRWEAHIEGGDPYAVPATGTAATAPDVVPQGYISGTVAAAACIAAGKRLCSRSEWMLACAGSAGRTYPYGDSYDGQACNEGRSQHPVVELFGGAADWSPSQMNDPRLNQLPDSLAMTGAYAGCVTPEGVHDLHGNLHEWVDDSEGTFKGGFYVDATINGAGCGYTTTAHSVGYHDYSTGFRCCVEARE